MDSDHFSKQKSVTNTKKGSRGTKREEIHKEEVAKEYFRAGMSAEFTAKQKGTPGRAKCYRLYSKWTEELFDNYPRDVENRQVAAKEKCRISIGRILEKAETQLNKLETVEADRYQQHLKNKEHILQQKEAFEKNDEYAKANEIMIPEYKINQQNEYLIKGLHDQIIKLNDFLANCDIALTTKEYEDLAILRHIRERMDELEEEEYRRRFGDSSEGRSES